jgi:putative FmdB family regulatory protein
MPRYQYQCSECQFIKTYFHGINESIGKCEKCELETMSKVLTNKFYTFTKGSKTKPKIGEITKQNIEDNKEILKTQKKESKEKLYEPS